MFFFFFRSVIFHTNAGSVFGVASMFGDGRRKKNKRQDYYFNESLRKPGYSQIESF